MKTECSFSVEREVLLAIREFQSNDEARYMLNGVHFFVCPEHVTLSATDGRTLGMIRIDQKINIAEPIEFTVDYPLVSKFEKHLGVDVRFESKDGKRGEVSFTQGGTTYQHREIEGNYPDHYKAVPSEKMGGTEFNVNAEYLNKFAKAARLLLGRTELSHVAIRGHGDSFIQHSVFIHKVPNFYGLIMPVRIEEKFQIPSWASEPRSKQEKERNKKMINLPKLIAAKSRAVIKERKSETKLTEQQQKLQAYLSGDKFGCNQNNVVELVEILCGAKLTGSRIKAFEIYMTESTSKGIVPVLCFHTDKSSGFGYQNLNQTRYVIGPGCKPADDKITEQFLAEFEKLDPKAFSSWYQTNLSNWNELIDQL